MLVISNIPKHEWITSVEDASALVKECLDEEVVAIDTETDGTDIVRDKALIFSIGTKKRRVALPAELLPVFKTVLEEHPKTLHNAKFDMHMVQNACGIKMGGTIMDTFVMAVLENTERKWYGLKFLASDGLFDKNDPRYIQYESIFGGKVKGTTDAIKYLGHDKVANYASMDAYASLTIFYSLRDRLKKIETHIEGTALWDIFLQEEVDFTHVLYDMERKGFLLDIPYLKAQTEIAEKKILEIATEFTAKTCAPINLNSPKQLSDLFYGVLNKPVKRRTAGGKSGQTRPSVNAEVVSLWAKEGDPYAKIVLEYRDHQKTLSTYLRGLVEHCDKNNRVHTNLVQGGTTTGRLASKEPNLQNIKRPEGDIYRLREAFIAGPGKKLIGVDYDQLEMRIMAELANEKDMIEMINKGWDVHDANASLIYEIPYEDIGKAKKLKKELESQGKVVPEEVRNTVKKRRDIKTIGFGLNYGQGAKAFSETLGCTIEEAKAKILTYFDRFPNICAFINRVHDYLHREGYVTTYSGRMRSLNMGMDAYDRSKRFQAERQSVNSIIQGTAADIVRLAMIYCWKDTRLKDLECELLLQIHDELIFECPEENVEEACKYIKENMEKPYAEEFTVKITATPETGDRWTDIH